MAFLDDLRNSIFHVVGRSERRPGQVILKARTGFNPLGNLTVEADRLILEAFTWTGKGSPTLGKRAEAVEYFRTHNRRPRDRDMIRSIFTRDKPGTSDPAVAEALADAELVFGDTIPTGTYLDMTANLPVVDPARVQAPVLIVRGEHDGIATEEDVVAFFSRLPNADRQLVILAGASHATALGFTRRQLWHAMRAFLEMPARLDGRS